ncbi:alpha/beta hydrolase [Roseofilum sp. BLCC_M154]|uniref:Alpha/beta hydrolase n=1 Tax=Roseofilum acuticapitatum BLCC-M154 TaxID=3022444 RepID=A0ABT7ASR7_9CYAN|nr:alpha/beta hydrolase [Roseofilum acuticapitatum]MDJ1169950.1 alpha/beta hydrolase [Roseofilum acuticapitatum BLCC-M154]
MPEITVRGVDHYYQWITTTPSASLPQKPVLIFLHGWAGSARYWESTAEAFKEEFDCLLYDLRGFGRSRLPQTPVDLSYALEEYAEDLAELLNQLGLKRVWINAHSTGASIAVLFAQNYPERVEKLILTCSGIFEYDRPSFEAFHKFGGYVVKFRPPWLAKIPLADRFFMARFLCRPIPDEQRQAFLTDFLIADYEAALGTIYTSVSEHMAKTMPIAFSQLSMPVLLISGEKDQIIPAPMGKKAADLNPNIHYQVIEKTAHFPMLEDPPIYLSCVREFMGIGA